MTLTAACTAISELRRNAAKPESRADARSLGPYSAGGAAPRPGELAGAGRKSAEQRVHSSATHCELAERGLV